MGQDIWGLRGPGYGHYGISTSELFGTPDASYSRLKKEVHTGPMLALFMISALLRGPEQLEWGICDPYHDNRRWPGQPMLRFDDNHL